MKLNAGLTLQKQNPKQSKTTFLKPAWLSLRLFYKKKKKKEPVIKIKSKGMFMDLCLKSEAFQDTIKAKTLGIRYLQYLDIFSNCLNQYNFISGYTWKQLWHLRSAVF